MQQHLHTVAIEPKFNSTYTQWLDNPDAAALTHSCYCAQTEQHLHTVASEPRRNSTYTQWLVTPDTTALTHSGC